MSELPPSEQMPRRPTYDRLLRRKHLMQPLPPPDEVDRADAIKVLSECYPPKSELDDQLLLEAERILRDYGEAHLEPSSPSS